MIPLRNRTDVSRQSLLLPLANAAHLSRETSATVSARYRTQVRIVPPSQSTPQAPARDDRNPLGCCSPEPSRVFTLCQPPLDHDLGFPAESADTIRARQSSSWSPTTAFMDPGSGGSTLDGCGALGGQARECQVLVRLSAEVMAGAGSPVAAPRAPVPAGYCTTRRSPGCRPG